MALSLCRFRTRQAEWSDVKLLAVRKTFKYKLHPTAEQEGIMAFVLRRCCELYRTGPERPRLASGDAWLVNSPHQAALLLSELRLSPWGSMAWGYDP